MQRALLPNILASLGLVLITWALEIPLFEWQIGSIKTDYPSDYEINIVPSPWITKLGESLDDSSSSLHKIFISMNHKVCLNEEGLNIAVERSSNDKELELRSIKIHNMMSWLIFGSFILIILSIIYMWWVIIWREQRRISEAVVSTVIIAVFFCTLIGIIRLLGPTLSWDYFEASNACIGAMSFRAEISKIHYEMPIVMLLGILAELGALGIILRELIRIIIQGKESSKSAVG